MKAKKPSASVSDRPTQTTLLASSNTLSEVQLPFQEFQKLAGTLSETIALLIWTRSIRRCATFLFSCEKQAHSEADGLRQDLSPLQSSGRLSLTPIQVERHTIPALATGQFDLIEFFRHGHTKLGHTKLDGVLTQRSARLLRP